MSYAKLKEDIEKMFYPMAKQININPNTISVCSILFTLIGVYFIINYLIYTGLAFVALGAFADFLDGTIAKAKKKVTKFGSLLDKFADRVNDVFFMAAPVIAGFIDPVIGIIAILLVLLASYLSSLIDSHGKQKNSGNKLSLRAVRIIIMFIGAILTPFYIIAWQYSFYLVILTSIYAIITRMSYAVKHIKG